MRILIIGNGGREHALAWHVATRENVEAVFVAPGNAGTSIEPKVKNIAIDPLNFAELITFVKQQKIELTIVGPEAPLCAGIVDAFKKENLSCFGPTQYAAQLEGSKVFSKAFMQQHRIPTAAFKEFTDFHAAKNYLSTQTYPLVIKADGLCGGKGVVIAADFVQAVAAAEQMLLKKSFGAAANKIIIEEFLQGQEASFIVITDGETALPLATAQDHKARDDGDKGPNTGGMGAYSPALIISSELQQQIMTTIIAPVLSGLKDAGHPYCGFLYAGLMIDVNLQPKVLEFNCRLGDPEAEVILFRLLSNLPELCLCALKQKLADVSLTWDPQPALGVVLAAPGYPDKVSRDQVITGLETPEKGCKIFHAGTQWKDQQIVSNGGRILCVCAKAPTLIEAKQQAYHQISKLNHTHFHYRRDIAWRAIG